MQLAERAVCGMILSVMPRYFFHLWTGERYEVDTVGLELPDADTAYVEAYRAAQDLCSEMISTRRQLGAHRFEVADPSGRKLLDLPFSELLGSPPSRRTPPEVLAANMARVRDLSNALDEEIKRAQRTMKASKQVLDRAQRSMLKRPDG
jgi:hypothetical protein